MTQQNRCPDCGAWLSTRYSAGQPHRCPEPPRAALPCICHHHEPECICTMPQTVELRVQATEQLRQAMATTLDGPSLRGRLEPGWAPPAVAVQPANQRQHVAPQPAAGQAPKKATHALKTVGWPYAAPNPQSAPAGALSPARAFCLGWVAGAASGLFVAGLAVLWWLSSVSP